jgi:putative transposase
MLGIGRLVYNQTIAAHREKRLPSLSFINARAYVLSECEAIASAKNFLSDFKNTNLEIKRQAVNDALKAIKNAISKYKKTKEISSFKFRSKKDPSQSLYVRQNSIGNNTVFKTVLGKMRTSENFSKPTHDSRLVIKRNKHWTLSIPTEMPTEPVFKGLFSDSICALDPGNRTFQTFYSPQVAGKIGDGDKSRLFRLCLGCDRLQSKISKSRGNTKRSLIKAYYRASTKIKNLVTEIHWKAARFLSSNFNTILLPVFETQSMISKSNGKSKLNSKTCRQLLTWSHYTFQQRLKTKAVEMGSRVILTSEEYTSKTCPTCGEIHSKLGGNKLFHCPSCNTTLDRDYNGARNVLLRFLSLLKSNNLSGLLRWEIPPS